MGSHLKKAPSSATPTVWLHLLFNMWLIIFIGRASTQTRTLGLQSIISNLIIDLIFHHLFFVTTTFFFWSPPSTLFTTFFHHLYHHYHNHHHHLHNVSAYHPPDLHRQIRPLPLPYTRPGADHRRLSWRPHTRRALPSAEEKRYSDLFSFIFSDCFGICHLDGDDDHLRPLYPILNHHSSLYCWLEIPKLRLLNDQFCFLLLISAYSNLEGYDKVARMEKKFCWKCCWMPSLGEVYWANFLLLLFFFFFSASLPIATTLAIVTIRLGPLLLLLLLQQLRLINIIAIKLWIHYLMLMDTHTHTHLAYT